MEADQQQQETETADFNKENMGDVVSTEVHEGLPMSDENRNVDSSDRPVLQPKRSGKDSVQNFLNEMAGEATGAMGDTLGMMGGDYPRSYSEALLGRGYGEQQVEKGQFQQQSDQESERFGEPRSSTPQKLASAGDSENPTPIGWSLEASQPVEPEHQPQERSLLEGRRSNSPWNISGASAPETPRSRKHSKYEVEEIDATEADVISAGPAESADEVGILAESLNESEMARLKPDQQEIGEIRTDKIDIVDFPGGPISTGSASNQPSALEELGLQAQVPDVLQQPGPREEQATDMVARPDENPEPQEKLESGNADASLTASTDSSQPSDLQKVDSQIPDVSQQPGPGEDQVSAEVVRPEEKMSGTSTVSGKQGLEEEEEGPSRAKGEQFPGGELLTPEARSEFDESSDVNLRPGVAPSVQPQLKSSGGGADEKSVQTAASRKKDKKKKKKGKKEQGQDAELPAPGTLKPSEETLTSQQPVQAVPESQGQKSGKKKKGKKKLQQQQQLQPASDQGLPQHAKDINPEPQSSKVTVEASLVKAEHPESDIPLKSHELNPVAESGSNPEEQMTELFTKEQQEDLGFPEFCTKDEITTTQDSGSWSPRSKSHGSSTTDLPGIPEDREQSAEESDRMLDKMRPDMKNLPRSTFDEEVLETQEDEQELLDTLPESERPQGPPSSYQGKASDEEAAILRLQKSAKVVVNQTHPVTDVISKELADSELVQTLLYIPAVNRTLLSLEDVYALTKELTPMPFRYGFSAAEVMTSYSWFLGKFFLRPFAGPLRRADHLLAQLAQRYVAPQ